MPSSWHERMDTIQNYGDDRSAMGRIFRLADCLLISPTTAYLVPDAGMYSPATRSVYRPRSTDSRFDPTIARAARYLFPGHGRAWVHRALPVPDGLDHWLAYGRWPAPWYARDDADVGWLYHFRQHDAGGAGRLGRWRFPEPLYWDLYNLVVATVVAQRWQTDRATMPEVEPQCLA